MVRPRKFDEDAILDAALEEGRQSGYARLSASRIAKHLGAPSGSLYHRYRSRDELVAALWLRTVERFQTGYVDVLNGAGTPQDRGREAARFVFDWCLEHPEESLLLLEHRREDLIRGDWPASVAKRAAKVNDPLNSALRKLAHDLSSESPDHERVYFACISIPKAALRDSLIAGKRPSESVAKLMDDAVAAVLVSA